MRALAKESSAAGEAAAKSDADSSADVMNLANEREGGVLSRLSADLRVEWIICNSVFSVVDRGCASSASTASGCP